MHALYLMEGNDILIEPQYLPMLQTASMNDTHFEEMMLINALASALEDTDVAVINNAFATLIEHTKEHYRHEEEMMLEKKFPPYPAHKEDHDTSLAEMQKAASNFKETENIDIARLYVNGHLIPWFLIRSFLIF